MCVHGGTECSGKVIGENLCRDKERERMRGGGGERIDNGNVDERARN